MITFTQKLDLKSNDCMILKNSEDFSVNEFLRFLIKLQTSFNNARITGCQSELAFIPGALTIIRTPLLDWKHLSGYKYILGQNPIFVSTESADATTAHFP